MPSPATPSVLTINAGSSSIKFSIYRMARPCSASRHK